MENGIDAESNVVNMGATGNPNAARLATLRERKRTIEESLSKCNLELRALCMQEADITGVVPPEMPLEPGETPPHVRRRIGTSYELSENLIKNSINKDENISDLELQIQVHANAAEAALGLANEQHISKTLRRQHMTTYQHHKVQYKDLQEKLSTAKEKVQQQTIVAEQLHKQKKKPRPLEQEDCISMTTNSDPFPKSELRHSVRSNKCTNDEVEMRYGSYQRTSSYKSTNSPYLPGSYPRYEENLNSGLYGLSLNGYKSYMERRETMHIMAPYPPPSQYSPQLVHSPSYQHQYPQAQGYQHHKSLQPVFDYSNQYKTMQHYASTKSHQSSPTNLMRQPSPNSSPNAQKTYYPPPPPNYRYPSDYRTQNPHQIQPHQQYEQNGMTVGLGGFWKPTKSGKMVWCEYSSSTLDPNWPRDKRFGSLDRRKNRRVHKRVSPSVDNKSATLASVPSYTDHVRTASIKSPQIINRMSQDSRQLVRTQSLGSVGAQTVDSVWPSDDNSSCESDNRSINDPNQSRRPKPREWMETSLDGPTSPTHSIISRSHSAVPSILAPEDKYVSPPPPPLVLPKPPLEIPAESNPSPRLPETNIEILNNNIPKNCTVVQAGHCKPYHEETKPFEMSDFYKYSTKFKKSPVKQPERERNGSPGARSGGPSFHKNLNEAFNDPQAVYHSATNHNLSSEVCSPSLDNSASLNNSSLNFSQISSANVAEHFHDEMNEWYRNQKFQIEPTSGGSAASASKGKSTATLV